MIVSLPGFALNVTVNVLFVTTACKTVTLDVPLSTICTKARSVAATAPVTVNASAAAPPTVVTFAAYLITCEGVIPEAREASVIDAAGGVNVVGVTAPAALTTVVATLVVSETDWRPVLPLRMIRDMIYVCEKI